MQSISSSVPEQYESFTPEKMLTTEHNMRLNIAIICGWEDTTR